jgi:hypothetical protein
MGRLLPEASAKGLEKALAVNTEDLVSRARLLGYYHNRVKGRSAGSVLAAGAKTRHILWFIKNVPDCKFAGDFIFSLPEKPFPKLFETIKGAWETESKAKDPQPQTLINFAL